LIENVLSSAQLAERIRAVDYSGVAATVVGYGFMGKHYVKALRALGVGRIRVCSPSIESSSELRDTPGVSVVDGGYARLQENPAPQELAIIATPTASLVDATRHLLNCGFKKFLIEKPVSLRSGEIETLASAVDAQGADAACAYNRLAYPSFHEARFRAAEDGGITSCTYTFTEFVHRIGPDRFKLDDLRWWGVANSLHVLSMAHGLIGPPLDWKGFRSGAISWHPSGATFAGAGISSREIPFSYHADWGSTGRWCVELYTHKSSYRLQPLENLFKQSVPAGEWEPVPLQAADPDAKSGIVEEVAAMLMTPSERPVSLPSLRECVGLTQYAEQVFGYQ
jgi:predicted dehydrogenase